MRSHKDHLDKLSVARAALVAVALVFSFSFLFAQPVSAGTWMEHMTRIPNLKHQTEELELELKNLIKEKRQAESDAKVRTLTLEIGEKYKALKEAGEKLEAETNHVRFKHPEQAAALDHKYVRFKVKTLHDLESEVGIDGKLDRIKQHVLATFPVPELTIVKVETPKISPLLRKPASLEESDVPEKLKLTK